MSNEQETHKMPTWQPIKTAPTDGSPILLAERGEGPLVCAWSAYGWRLWSIPTMVIMETPTHWMPLPDPPDATPAPEVAP